MQYKYTTYIVYSILVIIASFLIGYAFKPLQEHSIGAIPLITAAIGSCLATLGLIYYVEERIYKLGAIISAFVLKRKR